ncbi:hypothetical protein ACFY2R_14775 [Micromonospora olivasterospora]|nr:hypothetical protein [Micromonospora olivasterospora]
MPGDPAGAERLGVRVEAKSRPDRDPAIPSGPNRGRRLDEAARGAIETR